LIPARLTRAALLALLVAGMPLIALALAEGGISLGLLAADFAAGLATRDTVRYNQYDSLLGWVTRPGLDLRDFYGPGNHLRTNAAGLRETGEFGVPAPEGRIRVVCSGDSYTFGLGVDNARTWCAALARMDPVLETINLGQPAYGLDQVYLRYQRDGRRLQPDIHVLAFIWDDFRRMRTTRFLGFDKPRLTLRGDSLEADNVPVPRGSSRMPRLADWIYEARHAVRALRASELIRRIRSPDAGRADTPGPAEYPLIGVVERLLVALDEMSRHERASFVLVHLPTHQDPTTPEAAVWRERIRLIAQRRDLDYLDLEDEFRGLSPDRQERLTSPVYGHYSREGQDWAAALIHKHLLGLPQVARRLEQAGSRGYRSAN
jgi:hypothetical protein